MADQDIGSFRGLSASALPEATVDPHESAGADLNEDEAAKISSFLSGASALENSNADNIATLLKAAYIKEIEDSLVDEMKAQYRNAIKISDSDSRQAFKELQEAVNK